MRRPLRTGALLITALVAAPAATMASEPEWGSVPGPTAGEAAAIGGHARGCLAGAASLPHDPPAIQAMRPSRNRHWGHPELVAFVVAFSDAARARGWTGLLVGDMAQPRGGPMTYGHRSHQSGLDVDVWFLESPARPLSASERDAVSAVSMVAADGEGVDPATWTPGHADLLRTAALFPQVDRIFVNPAIKRELCRSVEGDRAWLAKIRPWWGHDHHFHVGLLCPADAVGCTNREPPLPEGDGCDAGLDWWFSAEAREQRQRPAAPPKPPTLDDLPPACRDVLSTP